MTARGFPWRSLAIKVTAGASLLGILLLWVTDHFQTASISRILQEEFELRLDHQAHQNRLRFDRLIRRHVAYVKVAANAFASEEPVSGGPTVVATRDLPAWLPERAVANALMLPDLLLAIGEDFRPRTVYQLARRNMPAVIPEISARLVAGSRQEPLLQMLDNRLYLLSTAQVPRPGGGWLMAVSEIDDDFLDMVLGALRGQSITAVVGGEDQRILASSDRARLPVGVALASVRDDFLTAGKGYLDYGFSEAHAGFVTLFSRSDLKDLTKPVVAGERNHRAILAAVLTAFFGLVLLYLAYRLRRLGTRVTQFMEQGLGASPAVDDHLDELDRLERQVECMAHEVIEHREALAKETKHRLTILHDQNQHLEATVEARTAELRSALAKAEKAVAAKGHFLAAASHDLRQPFQAMRLFIDTLTPMLEDTRAGAVAKRLDEAMRGGEELLSSLLRVSCLDAGMVNPNIEPVALDTVLAQVYAECEPQAAAKGLTFRRVPTSARGLTDRIMLTRMVRNLVINAIRYTPRGGIVMGVRRHGNDLALVVADTGIGISEDHLPFIFDDFFQVANPARDRSQGLGLGLSVVMRKAQLLGHSVKVTSRPNHGTVFAVGLAAA